MYVATLCRHKNCRAPALLFQHMQVPVKTIVAGVLHSGMLFIQASLLAYTAGAMPVQYSLY